MPSFIEVSDILSLKGKALSLWIVGFLLRLHSRYFIPDVAFDALMKFLYILFTVLAPFSRICEVIKDSLPQSLHDTSCPRHYDNVFDRYVVCPIANCNCLDLLGEAIDVVGTKQTSRRCSNVMYPNHTYPSYRKPCQALLLKTVTTSTGKKFLYPFKSYCYKPLKSSLQKLGKKMLTKMVSTVIYSMAVFGKSISMSLEIYFLLHPVLLL